MKVTPRPLWIVSTALVLTIGTSGVGLAQPARSQFDYTRLGHPSVAEQLDLSDQQRAAISQLLQQRATELAAAEEDQRAAIAEQNQQQLAELLTDAQRAKLESLPGQQKLLFSFDQQKWPEVLGWFARQAGFSLVLDKPPPDTFSFRDTKGYSPVEAIDLLNSVLVTKGYTLIRRGRLLLCVDISAGIPSGLIPRVRLDELDQFGTFELVSVLFPLGRRPVQTVDEEVKALLGAQGTSVALPQTKQLLVTETAGKMRAISAIITSIPEPSDPKPAEPKKEPPKPELAVYPAAEIDPQAAVEMLGKLIKGATFSFDTKAEQISAYATPSQQTAVKAALDKMAENRAPGNRPYLELYACEEADLSQIQQQAQLAAPSAEITVDAEQKRLLVFADTKDQVKVKAILAKLDVDPDSVPGRQVVVYRLRKTDPATVIAVVQSILPRARATADAATRRVVIHASEEDHKIIQQLIQQIDPAADDPQTPALNFYAVPEPAPKDLVETLKAVVPQASISLQNEGRRLRAVATPEDHELLKRTIERLAEVQAPPEEKQVQIYSVSRTQLKRFQGLRTSLGDDLADVQIVEDAEAGELAIAAKPAQHEFLASLLDTLKREVPAEQRLRIVAYPVTLSDPENVRTVLRELYPEAKMVADEKTGQLVIWATPADHEQIERIVKQLDAPAQPGSIRKLMSYPVGDGDPRTLLPALEKLVPEMTLSADRYADSILAWGIEADHQRLAETIAQYREGNPEQRRTLMTYPTGHRDPNELRRLLDNIAPRARFSADQTSRQVAVWATNEEHRAIREAVKLLTESEEDESGASLVVYSLPRTGARAAVSVLQRIVPSAQLEVGASREQLIVWASPTAHKTLNAAIQELEEQNPETMGLELQTYRASRQVVERATEIVRDALPSVRFVSSGDPERIMIWGRANDHESVGRIVETLKEQLEDDERTLAVYVVRSSVRQNARSMLQSAVPGLTYLQSDDPGRLLIWAKPEQHAAIQRVLDQLEQTAGASEQDTLEVYPLGDVPPATVVSALDTGLTEGISIREDAGRKALVVRAPPQRHRELKLAIDEVLAKLPDEIRSVSQVYRFQQADPQAARRALSALLPNVTLAVDEDSRSLIATATPSDHEIIRQTVEQLDVDGDQQETRVYRFRLADPEAARSVLQAILPRATFAVDDRSRSLVASASAEDQRTIADTVKELETGGTEGRTTRVHRLRNADADNVAEIVEPLVPNATIIADDDRQLLLATALPEDQAKIQSTIEQLDQDQSDVTLQAYRIRQADSRSVYEALSRVYRRRYAIQVSWDEGNEAVLVRAPQFEHEKIAKLIQQMDQADLLADTTVETYPLQDVDPESVVTAMESLLDGEKPQPRLTADQQGSQIVAVATAAQHALIRAAVSRMRGESRELEVYQLQLVDPMAVETAMRRLFIDSPNPPTADTDLTTQKLLVRGTQQQQAEVRKLLVKMGEAGLSASSSLQNLRVVPFDGDVESALQQLRNVWPRLRSNELRILSPPDAIPSPSDRSQPSSLDNALPPRDRSSSSSGAEPPDPSAEETESQLVRPVALFTPGDGSDQDQSADTEDQPAVIVVPGNDRVTIASQDTEALVQFERLLRSLSPSDLAGPSGGNFDVIALRNAGAAQMANLMRELARRIPLTSASGLQRVSIAPDDRLNALVIHGSRADRATVTRLMRVLDTASVPEYLASKKPEIRKVHNAEAADILVVVRSLYKTQLTTGGNRPQIEIPEGVSSEVASVLQQINASTSGPLLTLEVDENTNSIVMVGPPELREEVGQLIQQLDGRATEEESRQIELIQLKSTNSENLQEALEFLRQRTRR